MDIADWIVDAVFKPPPVPTLRAVLRDGIAATVKAIFFAGALQAIPIALVVGFIAGCLFASNLRREKTGA